MDVQTSEHLVSVNQAIRSLNLNIPVKQVI